MADKTPIRYAYDGSSLTGIAEYATSDTVGVAFGGTGATSLTDDGILLGNTTSAIQVTSALTTDGQIVIGGSSGPAVANISGTSNEVEITNGDGTITIGLPSTLCSTGTLEIGGNVNFDGGTFVFNDAGADKDFRIEGDTDANLFISDASTDRIGIGTATPSHLLDVEGVANFATCIVTPIVCSTTCIATSVICTTSDTVIGGDLTIAGDDLTMGTNTSGYVLVADGTNYNPVAISGDVTISSAGAITSVASNTNLTTLSNVTSVGTLTSLCISGALDVGGNVSLNGGAFIFNEAGADKDFRIEGDTVANLFITDASVDRVGIGTATPSHLLDVDGVAHVATCLITPKVCITSQYVLPTADGSAGQIMCTDGSGTTQFAAAASSGHTIADEGSALASRTCLNFIGGAVAATDNSGTDATDVTITSTNALLKVREADGTECSITLASATIGGSLVSDTSPQLGGNLDVNGNSIVSASNGNIPITPNGSGIVILDGICHPIADGSAGQILCTDGSAALQFATLASTSPGGSDTYVQFNNSSAFGGSANLTWDDTTLAVAGPITATSLSVGDGNITNVGDIAVDTMSGDADSNTTIGFPGSDILTFSTAGTEQMRIDANGLVGFGRVPEGTNSTDTHIAFGGTGLLSTITAQDAGEPVYFSSNGYNSGGWKYIINDEAHLFGMQSGTFQFYNAAAGAADSAISWTQRLHIAADGDIGIGTGAPSHLLDVEGYINANSGIQFQGDTAAANALDDYEEGTWTPVVYYGGTGGTAYSLGGSNTTTYTKIGRVVYISAEIEITNPSASNSGSSTVILTGLPFTAANVNQWWRQSLTFNLYTKANASVYGAIGANDTYMSINAQFNNGDAGTSVKSSEIYRASGSVWMGFSGYYHVA